MDKSGLLASKIRVLTFQIGYNLSKMKNHECCWMRTKFSLLTWFRKSRFFVLTVFSSYIQVPLSMLLYFWIFTFCVLIIDSPVLILTWLLFLSSSGFRPQFLDMHWLWQNPYWILISIWVFIYRNKHLEVEDWVPVIL